MRHAVLVVNPISGSPRRRNTVERFVTQLERQGIEVRIHPTAAAGDGAAAARRAADEDADFVVAAGGDGTVNEVAQGLVGRPGAPALAVLPLGTSNLVARHLGIPLHAPEAAAEGLGRQPPLRLDVGRVGERPFLACAGIGIDASIVEDISARRRGHIGYFSYAAPMWRAALGYEMPHLTVSVERGDVVEGSQVLVLNMRPYAAFLEPAPHASATDGLLDVIVLRGSGTLRVLRWSLRAMRSRLLDDPDATHLRCRALRVESTTPAPIQIDGDVGGRTPVDMLVEPAALRVVRPAACTERRDP